MLDFEHNTSSWFDWRATLLNEELKFESDSFDSSFQTTLGHSKAQDRYRYIVHYFSRCF